MGWIGGMLIKSGVGLRGYPNFCETVKGDFFASFHMETLVFRLLESSERSECGCSRSLSNVLYLYSQINCLTLPYI